MKKGKAEKSSTRTSRRRKKTDRWLNWAIAIVSIFILAIGCVILVSLLKSPGSDVAATHTASHQQSDKKTEASQSEKKKDASKKAGNAGNEDSANANKDDNESNDSNDNGSKDKSSDNSSGASSASDSAHHASYDQGTADWNAQIAAIASATGIDQSNMVIYWLGNGGAPNSSLARVASKSTPGQKYVVHLVYKGGKWQAESVQKP